jgi:predicted nucleic acid-binding protein
MILVDSSVWIDYFNGRVTPQSNKLDSLLGAEPLGIGDIILTEVLQGFRADADYKAAKAMLTTLDIFPMLGTELALKSAEHFRALRKQGVTVRKTADVIIATFCIAHRHSLLFSDRDFIPFVEHLGLRAVTANG